jgi:hypothetical protein
MRRGGSLVGGQLTLGELILPVFLCRVHGQSALLNSWLLETPG